MKKVLSLFTFAAIALSFSSCCSMFGSPAKGRGTTTESKQVVSGYDTVTEEVQFGSGKGGMVKSFERKNPRYKTVTAEVKVPCQKCTRYYCPKKDCCGTTSDSVVKMATGQGSTGSPHIGLIPTMKKLAE